MDTDLTTEARNPASARLDALSPLEIVRLMNAEDQRVAPAVGRCAAEIAAAIDAIAQRLRGGGRLVYLGAGTSGRLGVLDATECPPTFNSPPEQVVGLIAGGAGALTRAVEGAEDRPEAAVADLDGIGLTAADAVVGIATSGGTPYVVAGLDHARRRGAYTIALCCNDGSLLADRADLVIAPVVGPEILTGSTRLKAGSATKMVLNMLSTGAMVRLGKTFGNWMVDLRATNQKLRGRTERIVRELTGLDAAAARQLLARCDGELKTAVVAQRRGVEPAAARELLRAAGGHLRTASDAPLAAGRVVPAADLVLGVDVGGTKVAALVAQIDERGEPASRGRGSAGPANPQSVGWDQALGQIHSAIGRALADAGLPTTTCVAALAIAGAGLGRREEQSRLADHARKQQWAAAVEVHDDAQAVLAAGTPDGWGIAVVAGTGAIVVGRSSAGHTRRAGGWGALVGDEGSGYALTVGKRSVRPDGAD